MPAKKKIPKKLSTKKNPKVESGLKELILNECIKIVSEHGPSAINFREIARRLNISHMAPYRHFASKEVLFTELGLLGFKLFQETLEKNLPIASTKVDLIKRFKLLKNNYQEFAENNPALYQIIFSTKLPDKNKFPELREAGKKAFSVLINQLANMKLAGVMKEEDIFTAALFTHMAVHGHMLFKNTEMLVNLTEMFSYEFDPEINIEKYLFRALQFDFH